MVVVTPVKARAPLGLQDDSVTAIVFVSDPELHSQPDRNLLQVYYGLTPTEADIAARLVAGESLDEIAAVRRYTKQTTQWYDETDSQQDRMPDPRRVRQAGVDDTVVVVVVESCDAIIATTKCPEPVWKPGFTAGRGRRLARVGYERSLEAPTPHLARAQAQSLEPIAAAAVAV